MVIDQHDIMLEYNTKSLDIFLQMLNPKNSILVL